MHPNRHHRKDVAARRFETLARPAVPPYAKRTLLSPERIQYHRAAMRCFPQFSITMLQYGPDEVTLTILEDLCAACFRLAFFSSFQWYRSPKSRRTYRLHLSVTCIENSCSPNALQWDRSLLCNLGTMHGRRSSNCGGAISSLHRAPATTAGVRWLSRNVWRVALSIPNPDG